MKNNIVHLHSCDKCKKVFKRDTLLMVDEAIVCQLCYNDALLVASAAEYYMLEAAKVSVKDYLAQQQQNEQLED